MQKVSLFSGFIWVIFILAGCTSTQNTLRKFGDPIETFVSEDKVIFSVSDNRKISPSIVKRDNSNTDYSLNRELSTLVENYFNSSLKFDSTIGTTRNINVYIDQFKFENSSTLKYSLRFEELYTLDTVGVIRVASIYESSGYENDYKDIIDFALTDCLRKYFNNDYSSARLLTIGKEEKNNSGDTAEIKEKSNEDSVSQSEEISFNSLPQKITLKSIGLTYIQGEKIVGGFSFYYDRSRCLPEDLFILKYGIGFKYLSIDNKEDGITGYMYGAWFPIIIQNFFSNNSEGTFIGATLQLMIGSERISYGYAETNSFYVGPSIEPFLGYKISDKFSLDAGPYVIVLAGSNMLPNDFGFRINTNIWF